MVDLDHVLDPRQRPADISISLPARFDSDGLHVGAAFYEQGGVDTRPKVELHDCELRLVVDGPSDRVRVELAGIAARLLERTDVSEVVWTVTKR